jgi:FkbM family methyltransferase
MRLPSFVRENLRRPARVLLPSPQPPASRDATPTAEGDRDAANASALRRVLGVASPATYLRASLNGYPLWLPRDTLRTMVHCAHWEADGRLSLWVEIDHLVWMMQHLTPGGTFLDVGTATGATTLPIAARGDIAIMAYEPATAARTLLTETLARNELGGVTIRPVAVSDSPGEVEFREYEPDLTGATPWQPETSSLAAPIMSEAPHQTYRVPVVTLDDDALPHCHGNVVIKIDVEGFEVHVLRGARRLLQEFQPYLSIDIHVDPWGDGVTTTEAAVVALLAGYRCERLGHVLVCSPAAS